MKTEIGTGSAFETGSLSATESEIAMGSTNLTDSEIAIHYQ